MRKFRQFPGKIIEVTDLRVPLSDMQNWIDKLEAKGDFKFEDPETAAFIYKHLYKKIEQCYKMGLSEQQAVTEVLDEGKNSKNPFEIKRESVRKAVYIFYQAQIYK